MIKATRGPRAAWIVGLGGAMGGSLLWACSSSSSPPILGDSHGGDGGEVLTDSSVADTASPPSEGAAPACTLVEGGCVSLQNCGAKVNVTRVAQTPPAASGGTVVPGTYVMTDLTIYTGTGGATGTTGQWFIETQYLSAVGDDAGAAPEAGAGDGGQAGDAAVAVEAGPASQVFRLLDVTESDSNPARTLTGTVTFAPPQRESIVYDCPSGTAMFVTTFTATSTQLQLIATEPAGVGVITYTKM